MKNNTAAEHIRVRIAPSPTGPAHIGLARTALFNCLFARQHKGSFILRIEDTDKERSDQQWTQEIIDELQWLQITWDEGPDIGGKFGPYKQSQRLDTYKKYLQQLLSQGKAYYCTCTAEMLEAKRQDQISRGVAPKYDGTCRDKHNAGGVIRFKVESKKVSFRDIVRGEVSFDTGLLGDVVIAKNLESPLYHFAVVVDDFLMQISHVIRGEDHISNTPRQVLLQEALGFPGLHYAHLPLLLNSDKTKMSKRGGDVAIKDYRQQGYLPEAIINFIALLGWNPGHEKEIFSFTELLQEFSLEKVQKGGAVFNAAKLDSINSYYIRQKPITALTKLCLPHLERFNTAQFSQKQMEAIIEVSRPRMKKLSDASLLCDFFFAEKLHYPKELLRWKEMGDREVRAALELCQKIISESKNLAAVEKELLAAVEPFNKNHGYPVQNRGYLLWPLRVALSGKEHSPGPLEIAEILGKDRGLERIRQALDNF